MSQSNALAQVKARAFIIGTIGDEGYFSVSSRPFFHGTQADALRECARLSNQNPGKAFVAMQMVGGTFLPQAIKPQVL
jgi:hypothetical protein